MSSSSYVTEEEKLELERIIDSIPKKDLKEAIMNLEYVEGVSIYAGDRYDDFYHKLSSELSKKVRPVVMQVWNYNSTLSLQDFLRHFCPELAKKYY